jgi:hypothetical protein
MDEITSPTNFEKLEVDVRMEIQILDTTYQIYSRPFTDIYFTTYKLTNDNNKVDFHQSDTTSCPNGWGIKLLNYTINNKNEKIILGAACENYNGTNYFEISIDYAEAEMRIDSTGHSSIIKTFAIYYK